MPGKDEAPTTRNEIVIEMEPGGNERAIERE